MSISTALPNALVSAGYGRSARTQRLIDEVRAGARLSASLEQAGIMPLKLVHLIRVGESSGRLVEVLAAIVTEAAKPVRTAHVAAHSPLGTRAHSGCWIAHRRGHLLGLFGPPRHQRDRILTRKPRPRPLPADAGLTILELMIVLVILSLIGAVVQACKLWGRWIVPRSIWLACNCDSCRTR